jgi:hypothetical protein
LGVPPAGVRRVRGLDAAIHDARRPGNPVFGPRTVSSWRCRSMMVSGRLGVVRLESGDTLCAFPKVSQGGKRERDLNVLSTDVKRYYDKRVTSSGIMVRRSGGVGLPRERAARAAGLRASTRLCRGLWPIAEATMTALHARVSASTDWGVTRGGQGRWCCTGLPTAYRVRARGTERRFHVIRDHELCEGLHPPRGLASGISTTTSCARVYICRSGAVGQASLRTAS